MQNAKKFVLLDQATYEKRASTNRDFVLPTTANELSTDKHVTQFDHDMKSVLDSKEPDDVKAKLYTQALNKFKALSQPPPTLNIGSYADVVTDEEILDSVPTTLRHKARRLLRFVRETTALNWNDRGELIYKQMVVPNSNIIELVNDLLRQRSSDRAIGWKQFASGLAASNVKISRDLVTNGESWKIVEGRPTQVEAEDVVNVSNLFQESTTTPARKSIRPSRESTRRKTKRRQRYGSWVEY